MDAVQGIDLVEMEFEVEAEHLALYLRDIRRGAAMILIGAAVAVSSLAPEGKKSEGWWWTIVLAIVGCARWGAYTYLLALPRPSARFVRLAKWAMYLSVLPGLLMAWPMLSWGPVLDAPDRVILTVIFIGGAFATIGGMGLHVKAYLAQAIPPIGASLVVWYQFRTEGGGMAMLTLIFLYSVFYYVNAYECQEAILHSLRMGYQNRYLLRQANGQRAEVERALTAKARFIASASHDIRQPVTAIELLLGTARRTENDVMRRELMERLAVPVHALGELLKSILDLARLDAQTVAVRMEPVSVASLLTSLADEFEPQAHRKHLDLKQRSPEHVLLLDSSLVRQILANLVDNAIKFTRNGGVEVEAAYDEDVLHLRVSDTGVGILEENLVQVFDEYFQVENPQRARTAGLGLGLSIVKRAVDLLDGSIRVESQVGTGTTVFVDLPAKIAPSITPNRSQIAPGTPHLGSLRILILDDDIVVAQAVETMLTAHGIDCMHTTNPAEAIEIINEIGNSIDCVILDYRLPPPYDGIHVFNTMNEYAPHLRGVIMTGDTDRDLLPKFEQAGCLVLHKPLTEEQLLAALSVSSKHLRRAT